MRYWKKLNIAIIWLYKVEFADSINQGSHLVRMAQSVLKCKFSFKFLTIFVKHLPCTLC